MDLFIIDNFLYKPYIKLSWEIVELDKWIQMAC